MVNPDTGREIDWDRVKGELSYISHGDHMGDVNNGLIDLLPALGFDEPVWTEDGYFRMPWNEEEEEDL